MNSEVVMMCYVQRHSKTLICLESNLCSLSLPQPANQQRVSTNPCEHLFHFSTSVQYGEGATQSGSEGRENLDCAECTGLGAESKTVNSSALLCAGVSPEALGVHVWRNASVTVCTQCDTDSAEGEFAFSFVAVAVAQQRGPEQYRSWLYAPYLYL
uniref:Uncharacterized protein n=1 Tax=Setaria digitata TaxID=48799 RepID=A0A915PCE9_9BILA